MDDQPENEVQEEATHHFDLSSITPVEHKFDHIIGNQLMCGLHDQCTSITISPTAVLESNAQGELMLVEKAV